MIPRIGNHNEVYSQLMNTYFQLESGLVVPCPMYFFSDNCAHAYAGINTIIQNNHILDEDPGFEELRNISTSKDHDREVYRFKTGVDEILRICDPEKSFEFAANQFNLKGMFPPDAREFFNTETLRDLYQTVNVQHYDFQKRKVTEDHKIFVETWEGLLKQYKIYADDFEGVMTPKLRMFLLANIKC